MHRAESSVVFYEDYFNDTFTTLTSTEIDLFYILLDQAEKQFNGVYHKEFHIELKQLPKNSELTLKKLRAVIMVVHKIDKDQIKEKEDINLIRRFRFHGNRLYFYLEKEILKPYIEHRKEFDHVFVKIDWALKSKYSKFLYRILKEHVNSTYEIHYEILLVLLNLTDPKYLANKAYSLFCRDILRKVVDDLCTNSDLCIDFYPIKDKHNKKKVDKIAFEITEQEFNQEQIELSAVEEMNLRVSKRIEFLASTQYDKVSAYKKIVDKTAYISTIIKQYNRDEIEAQIRIDDWLEYVKTEFGKGYGNQPAVLSIDPYGKKEIITINNNYQLWDVFQEKKITYRASLTLKKLNCWLQDGADISFKLLGKVYDDLTISYINLLP